MGVFGKLIQCTMPILSKIPSSCTIPSMCLRHCPSYYYPVAFLDRYAQIFQIYSNRKITDPHFQDKNVTHLSPSLPVHMTAGSSNCSDKTEFQTTILCLQTKASVRSHASVLRWRYCISRAYQLKYQAWWKWPNTYRLRYDRKFLQLWTIQALICLSLYTHELIHNQCWHGFISRV